jgi:hypothetical protein
MLFQQCHNRTFVSSSMVFTGRCAVAMTTYPAGVATEADLLAASSTAACDEAEANVHAALPTVAEAASTSKVDADSLGKSVGMKARPRKRFYVNLTNGVEALPALSALVPPAELRFTRLQSSHCEARAWDKVLAEIDHDLLWSLATGCTCYLLDFASRNPKRGVPRSFFVGVEFVKYSLAYLWFGRDSPLLPSVVMVREKNLVRYWRDVLSYEISKSTKKRIRYYTPFAEAAGIEGVVDLLGVYGRSSVIDGNKVAHVEIVRDWVERHYGMGDGGGCDEETEEDATMKGWLQEWRLAEFDATIDADELRRIQEWMVRGLLL